MRLIDADKITFFNCLAKTGNGICCHAEGIVSKSAIEMQPTVEAITVEWFQKYIDRNNPEWNYDFCYVVLKILEDWERENEVH